VAAARCRDRRVRRPPVPRPTRADRGCPPPVRCPLPPGPPRSEEATAAGRVLRWDQARVTGPSRPAAGVDGPRRRAQVPAPSPCRSLGRFRLLPRARSGPARRAAAFQGRQDSPSSSEAEGPPPASHRCAFPAGELPAHRFPAPSWSPAPRREVAAPFRGAAAATGLLVRGRVDRQLRKQRSDRAVRPHSRLGRDGGRRRLDGVLSVGRQRPWLLRPQHGHMSDSVGTTRTLRWIGVPGSRIRQWCRRDVPWLFRQRRGQRL
jgi:hypothetical protein